MTDESKLPCVLRQKLPKNLEIIKYGQYKREDNDYAIHLYLKENDLRVDEEGSEVIPFLRGKNILITGATGFLGKLLLEKLLRCCKDIGKIFIIVRTKKGKDPQTRVNEFLDNWVFYKLSLIRPNYKEKIIGLSGDFELDSLGLSVESRNIIQSEVNIIYHVAATIRFDEKLKKAVKINIRGTQEMLELARGCKNLNVFVHLSTAFSNCHNKVIDEAFYPPLVDPYSLMKVVDELPEDIIERITPQLLGSVPNTYAFTKQIAEDIVRRESSGIPTCIHRPSIVIASVREPVRAWVDNIFGPVGLIEGAALGLLHVMIGNPNGRCDMVPADYVINNCILASYKTAQERQLEKVKVFNYTLAEENPLYWRSLAMCGEQGRKIGSSRLLLKGFSRFTNIFPWYYFLNFLLHTIPSYIIDFVMVQLGHKPLLRKAYAKIGKFIDVLSHFTLNEYTFVNTNAIKLWNDINEKDKEIFMSDMKSLVWQDYFDTYLVAMREFLVKDFLDTLEEGRWAKLRVDIIHYTTVAILTFLSVYYLLNTIFFFIPVTIIVVLAYYTLTSEL